MKRNKLTINYPMRFSPKLYRDLQAIAKKRVWPVSQTIRFVLAEGVTALKGKK